VNRFKRRVRWAAGIGEQVDTDDLDLAATSYTRSVSEPVPKNRPDLLAVIDSVGTTMLFTPEPVKVAKPPSTPINVILCSVSIVLGCLAPALVDLSRTATAIGPEGERQRQLPYTPLSVVRAESAFNVTLGVLAIALQPSLGGFSTLWRLDLHAMMFPLTIVYCLGDLAALFAIGSGGGPLYMAVTNSRLLFAAGLSQAFLGRRQSPRQWVVLAEITLATAAYAVLGSGQGKADAGGGQAMVGTCWAVVKAALSGAAAVLTESRYKTINLWHANTLLKAQSLTLALVATALSAMVYEEMPICEASAKQGAPWCIDHRGWDYWTWVVLIAEISAGWLSVAVLTYMSAIAKFICKTATAPSLYLAYCFTGFGGLRFETPRFIAVLLIAVGILAYTMEPYLEKVQKAVGSCCWVREYRH